jgi:hypothetical protein
MFRAGGVDSRVAWTEEAESEEERGGDDEGPYYGGVNGVCLDLCGGCVRACGGIGRRSGGGLTSDWNGSAMRLRN